LIAINIVSRTILDVVALKLKLNQQTNSPSNPLVYNSHLWNRSNVTVGRFFALKKVKKTPASSTLIFWVSIQSSVKFSKQIY